MDGAQDLAEGLALGRAQGWIRTAIDQQPDDFFAASRDGVGERSMPFFGVPGKEPVVAEAAIKGRRIFFEDGSNAVNQVVLDGFDDVDGAAQNEIASFFVAGVVCPARGRAMIFFFACATSAP